MVPSSNFQYGPGEKKLRATIQRGRTRARNKTPEPYDDDWGWWVNERLTRIEGQIKALITIATAALAAEVIRLGLSALGILH